MTRLLLDVPGPADPPCEGVVWDTPQTMFWHTAKYFRRRSPHPDSLRSAMAALLDFTARSDLVGQRARDLLKTIRIGRENDASAHQSQCIYMFQQGGESTQVPAVESEYHDQLARIECEIANAERRITRQTMLVEKLSSTLWDSRPALDLLQTMQKSLELMQQRKKIVLRDFERRKSA